MNEHRCSAAVISSTSSCNADGVEFGLSLEDFADGLDAESFNCFYAEQAEEASEQKKARR